MKCPQCSYIPPRGRPKKLDDEKVLKMRKAGKSLADIAAHYGVTRGAIQAAIIRKRSVG